MTDIVIGECPDTFLPIEVDYEHTKTTTHVVGSPGYGKSTLLGNLAEQFHQAGEGVLVLDIKGDLARDIASRTKNPDDTIYVKLGELKFHEKDRRHWTINPFDGHLESPTRATQIRESVVQSFERMGLAQLDTMANIRHTIEIATDLALNLPDPTYLDLYCIIVDEAYREAIIRDTPNLDPVTKREWRDLRVTRGDMTSREVRQFTRTARNRLHALIGDPYARNASGWYTSTIKLRQWLDEGKMVLIDLGEPLQIDTGVDLGNMIIAHLLTEIFQRARSERKRTWRIVVDEFHDFIGASFAKIITEARSYNTFLVVAHHDRGQLAAKELEKLRSALGFAGLVLRLRQSVEDRVGLASIYGQEAIQEYLDLKEFEARATYFSYLEGNKITETIMLNDWPSDPEPGQLEKLEKRAKGMTIHRDPLRDRLQSRYWVLLDADANRDRLDSDGNTQTTNNSKGKAKSQVRSEQGEDGQADQPDPFQAEPSGNAGADRPTSIIDQLDASGSVLPRTPPTRRRRGGKATS
jgi:hypothetical protein